MSLKFNDAPSTTFVALSNEQKHKNSALEMQEIQSIIDRNKMEIMRSIQKIIDEQAIATMKYERNEFKKNLELAQLNLTELDKYLKLAMETTQKNTNAAIYQISEKVKSLETSNQMVTMVFESVGGKLVAQNETILKNLGKDAQKAVEKSLAELDGQFKQVLSTHQQIAVTVERIYSYKGFRTVGLWSWRWLLTLTSLYMLQRIFGIDSMGNWFKVLTGIALF